ncbi:hypothetical protein EVAR_53591_1 [Eumeta japonica]|uniref:Uncharacterized protein n=1 Tax=Eumeta variegata TaxID=151549 RepID=A0A4C1YKF6_EUMVA|nr:hypothetical protein EVAR_53591_1 [Eumeta japonica]
MLRCKREKWSKQVTVWYPRDGFRSRGRKAKRWEDDLIMTLGPLWTRVAADRQQWKELEEAFANKITAHLQAVAPRPGRAGAGVTRRIRKCKYRGHPACIHKRKYIFGLSQPTTPLIAHLSPWESWQGPMSSSGEAQADDDEHHT